MEHAFKSLSYEYAVFSIFQPDPPIVYHVSKFLP